MKIPFAFHHASLFVRDVPASAEFYQRALGLEEIPNRVGKSQIRWFVIDGYRTLHLIGGDPELNRPRQFSTHLALATAPFDATIAHLERKGIADANWLGSQIQSMCAKTALVRSISKIRMAIGSRSMMPATSLEGVDFASVLSFPGGLEAASRKETCGASMTSAVIASSVRFQAAADLSLMTGIGREADVHVVADVCPLGVRNGPSSSAGFRDIPHSNAPTFPAMLTRESVPQPNGSSRFDAFGSGVFAAFQRYSLKNPLLQGIAQVGDEFA